MHPDTEKWANTVINSDRNEALDIADQIQSILTRNPPPPRRTTSDLRYCINWAQFFPPSRHAELRELIDHLRKIPVPPIQAQAPILNLAKGLALQAQGLSSVIGNNLSFVEHMRAFAKWYCINHGGEVSADELREYATLKSVTPHHENAWGGVFRSGEFVKTGKYKLSAFPSNQGRNLPIWTLKILKQH